MTAFEFAQTVTQLPADQQNAFLACLRDELTEDEYQHHRRIYRPVRNVQQPRKV